MINKQTKFILAASLQFAIIFLIIIFKLSILTGGTDILLRIAPVDPRDVLRGDYVTFQYYISNTDSYYANSQQIQNGDKVYVILRPSGKYWDFGGVQKNKPQDSSLFIKGVVESGGVGNQNDFSQYRGNSRLHIVYGIEQYFIPEGRGQNFNFGNREAAARVAIDGEGRAAIQKIYVDDKPWP